MSSVFSRALIFFYKIGTLAIDFYAFYTKPLRGITANEKNFLLVKKLTQNSLTY